MQSIEKDVTDLLYGDVPLAEWAAMGMGQEPWSFFAKAQKQIIAGERAAAIETLLKISDMPGLESRQYLQACNALSTLGYKPLEKTIYGVIAEVAVEDGVDVVAIYADYHARYYNFSGRSIVWEHPDQSIDYLVDEALEAADELIKHIGPWNGKRPGAPGKGNARLSLLTSHGLHFGEGPIDALATDTLGGPLFNAMFHVMQSLIEKTEK